MIDLSIKTITEEDYDPSRFALLLKKSRGEGLNLILRMTENWENGTNRFNRDGEAFYAAEHEGRYLAVGGRSFDPYIKDPTVLRVRHVYVLPEWRRLGIASTLMKRVLDIPRGPYKKLTLRTLNPAARKFYEHLGFSHVGDEGDTTHEMEL